MSEKKKKRKGGDPIEATSVLPPFEYTPSEKEQAILDRITESDMVLLTEMNPVELGSLGKLLKYKIAEIKGRPRKSRYACLYGWVKPPDPEIEES